MPSPGSRRWLRYGLVAVPVLLVMAGGAVAFVLAHSPHNVSHPNVEFTSPATTPPPKQKVAVDNFSWPRYGFDAERTHYFPGADPPAPPFHIGWYFQDFALLEFPPVIYQNSLYLIDDDGSAKALDKRTGHKLWETKVGTLAAASPALGISQGLMYVALLSSNRNATQTQVPGNGVFAALSMKTGRIAWSKRIPSGTESSPIAYGNAVYFGDQAGTVYSLNATTGQVDWTFHASGPVKGGPALWNGVLYFGDYAGRAYAISAATGHQIWATNTSGADFGFGSGNFYSTPAVAFGRVYMGNTDGRVYSFGARTGALAWATSTGAYVYASPAVANTPGLGPTVYIGSYDGRFYAFNAQSGAIRWTHNAGGKVSGAATIVDNVVYYSTLASRTTTGLNVRTGNQVFTFPQGAFNPVIADPGAIYLDGYSTVFQLLPKGPNPPGPQAHRAPSPPTQRRLSPTAGKRRK
ncbi:MAG: PQQ-like beta-propeller repeat protein [Solirubrobacterales bacterium]|nr:PQQ-like beta-propeller repeat protein [Solirubrobacterales bacterium]